MSSGLLGVRSQEYEIYDGSRLKDTRERVRSGQESLQAALQV